MELPPELVAVIREYSRPHFKYFREYNRVLRLMNLDQWLVLREGLRKSPEQVLAVLLRFEETMIEFTYVQEFKEDTDPETWYETEIELDFYEKRCRMLNAKEDLLYTLCLVHGASTGDRIIVNHL